MSSDLPGDPPPPTIAPDLDPVVAQPDPTPPPAAEAVPPTAEPVAEVATDPGPEPPPPAVVATGKVVEAREAVIIIRSGFAPGEADYLVNPGHGAVPGHTVTIFADGSVQLGNYTAPEQSIAVPSKPPE